MVVSGAAADCLTVLLPCCRAFAPAWGKDPEYSRALQEAHAAGVLVLPVRCTLQPQQRGAGLTVALDGEVPLEWEFGRAEAEAAAAEKAAQSKGKRGAAASKGTSAKRRKVPGG